MRMSAFFLMSVIGAPLWAAPVYTVPPPDEARWTQGRSEEQGRRLIGFVQSLELDSETDGQWGATDEVRTWDATVAATGARALSLHFAEATLTAGAVLYLLDDAGTVRGAYDERDVRDGVLITALVPGELLHLHLDVPVGQSVRLRLSQANVVYRRPLAKSGDCNIDVACSAAESYQDQVRSTVLLAIPSGDGGFFACSGLLVNTLRNDQTPYLLTADHCEISPSNAGRVQVYWKFQKGSCEQPGEHTHNDFSTQFSHIGTQWLADGEASDFTLLILGSRAEPFIPPASFEPFWSGWDASGRTPQRGIGVHHPNGNEKAISLFYSAAQATEVEVEGRLIQAWQLVWDEGTTEPGSSGSGLWNQDGRVVGVLSGGEASCSSQDSPDYYGRLALAWSEGPACEGQLKCWLDPDDSGALVLDGHGVECGDGGDDPDCGSSLPPSPTPAPQGGGGGAPGIALLLGLALLRAYRTVNSRC